MVIYKSKPWFTIKFRGDEKMKLEQNKAFRKRIMKAAKVEDLYFYLEKLKEEEGNKEVVSEIQRFIEFQLGYERVTKQG